ncbi:MAG: hypothetical protein Ct9H300mP4_12180 [Gammaproteobacteria bacterium]|nr:MAG: hypothetical protein Ct9H300mP4_12180 [Gammaproteobacteria bacterium]
MQGILDGYKNPFRPLPAAAVSRGLKNKVDSFLVFDVGARKTFKIKKRI